MEFVWLVFEGDAVVAVCNTHENADSWIGGYVAFNCQWEPEGSGKADYMREQLKVVRHVVQTSIP
jgi:hypothetical protein